jgi:two-component system vancomycin resistance associated response regulator VraR
MVATIIAFDETDLPLEGEPAVVVLDEAAYSGSSGNTRRRLTSWLAARKVVLLLGEASGSSLESTMAVGADAVATNDDTPQQFVDLVRSLLDGRGKDPGRNRASGRRHRAVRPDDLTPGEIKVLRRLALGHGNKTIASDLGVSVNTVRTHVQHVMDKLGVHTRLGVVAFARETGVLDTTSLREEAG